MDSDLYVLWDIESVNVPRGHDPRSIVPSIVHQLHTLRYAGVFAIEAVAGRFTEDRVPRRIRLSLEATGVRLTSMESDDLQVADEEIRRRMISWADQRSRGVLVIIAADRDLAATARSIRARNPFIHIILITIPSSIRGGVHTYPHGRGTGRFSWDYVLSQGFASGATAPALQNVVVAGCSVILSLWSILWAYTSGGSRLQPASTSGVGACIRSSSVGASTVPSSAAAGNALAFQRSGGRRLQPASTSGVGACIRSSSVGASTVPSSAAAGNALAFQRSGGRRLQPASTSGVGACIRSSSVGASTVPSSAAAGNALAFQRSGGRRLQPASTSGVGACIRSSSVGASTVPSSAAAGNALAFQRSGGRRLQPCGRVIPRGRLAYRPKGRLEQGAPSQSCPELHQATSPTLQAVSSQPTVSEVSPTQMPEPTDLAQQVEQLSLEQGAPSQAIQPLPSSSKAYKFPMRPGKGQTGKRCIVKANHFFTELPDKDLHQYDVTITPEVPSRGVNRAVMKQLVELYRDSHLGRRLPAYDGRKSLYTAGPLPFVSKEFRITLLDEEEGAGGQRREREFKVVIKLAARADLHHLGLFLEGKQANAPQEALQVLDIVLRELPTSRYTPVGRSFYSPNIGRESLGDGLESWRGFYQSIRPTQMGLSLNIDMSSTAFIEALPVITFVCELLNRDISSRPLSDDDRVKIKRALRGVKVEVTHRGNMRQKYRISGLTAVATRELTFPVDERNTQKSVVEYFHETYGFRIQHTQLPCLQVGNSNRPNYLPMEVCEIVVGQRYSKRLNERQITALLKVTCQRPQEREKDILRVKKYAVEESIKEDPYAKEFGIKISTSLASVEARILPPPWLKYHDSGREGTCLPQVGQWNMMNKKMINGGTVNSWICINFSGQVQDSLAHTFCQELAQMCYKSGMAFNPQPVLPPVSARPEQVEKVLKTRYHDATSKLPKGKEIDLLIVILPDNNGSLYGDLKRICETELGIVSQCCLTKHVFKMSKQYMANVALKINVKVGGRNTVLVDALSRRIPLVSDRPTIIFGADVTHPHPGEDSSPSIAAVVASQDWPEITKYAGLVCAQAHRQELIQDLFKEWKDPQKGVVTGGMIKELLIAFRRSTGHKPLRIIFYRDGVSEGQFYQVLLYELDAIRKACASLEAGYQPPVTFVVVQKRHHTRLFAQNHNDRHSVDDRSGNILPGTVVDSKICHPTEFDFYLCSHAGIQGTSRPAHYHVLWDENNFTADGLQSLTNNLCYTYARCTRSVSIVPPAYYAHLAASRARFYMEPETSEKGSMASGSMARGGGMAGRSTRGPHVNAAVRPLPALKENVKRVMFYC